MDKIIVFGGSGFIGSHVADALSDKGYDVTVFDSRKSPYIRGGQKMIVGDILDESLVNESLKGADIVMNFAGVSNIDECSKKPLDAVRDNIMGNTVLLDASVRADVKRFVFASSVYVYGQAGEIYRVTKQSCELLIETYKKIYGLDYTIIRYGSLYGPRSDEKNSIYRIVRDALVNKKITYHGTGEEVREYIHVADAAQLTAEVLKEDYKNRHIVLTGSKETKYRELLDMINEMLQNTVKIEYLPKVSESHYKITPYSFKPRIGKKLAINPHTDMGQGILALMEDIHKRAGRDKKANEEILIDKGE
jgi:UDP-glucose 4-epimerase